MDWWRLLVAAGAAMALAAAASAQEAHVANICELKSVCTCKPDTISCVCSKDVQNLVVNPESVPGKNLNTLTKFEVKDCNSLSLLEQAFKSTSRLELVHISNVKNVSISGNVFAKLQSLLVDIVGSLVLHKGAMTGIHGLNNIVIMKTHIPFLVEGALFNINDLQEFRLKEVNITEIEKEAVLIDLKQLASKAEILQSKIGRIQSKGLQIGNGSIINMQDTEIHNAEPNSIRLGALESVTIKGNKFQPGVDVAAAKIIYKQSIDFTKNTILNVDIANAANLDHMPKNETIFTLDRLLTFHGGNNVNCKCIDPASKNITEPLKQNSCVRSCSEATVAKFLESCQKNNAISVEERLKAICKNTADKMTTTATPYRPQPPTVAPKKKSGSGRNSVYILMPVAFFFFHTML